ncbi:hypothetical protein AFLA_012223 [Aspergillus flavus NRRL3357]|nr:hypothetical protein AFLA_012223 [Aspergillus flavus NRRL3357]
MRVGKIWRRSGFRSWPGLALRLELYSASGQQVSLKKSGFQVTFNRESVARCGQGLYKVTGHPTDDCGSLTFSANLKPPMAIILGSHSGQVTRNNVPSLYCQYSGEAHTSNHLFCYRTLLRK